MTDRANMPAEAPSPAVSHDGTQDERSQFLFMLDLVLLVALCVVVGIIAMLPELPSQATIWIRPHFKTAWMPFVPMIASVLALWAVFGQGWGPLRFCAALAMAVALPITLNDFLPWGEGGNSFYTMPQPLRAPDWRGPIALIATAHFCAAFLGFGGVWLFAARQTKLVTRHASPDDDAIDWRECALAWAGVAWLAFELWRAAPQDVSSYRFGYRPDEADWHMIYAALATLVVCAVASRLSLCRERNDFAHLFAGLAIAAMPLLYMAWCTYQSGHMFADDANWRDAFLAAMLVGCGYGLLSRLLSAARGGGCLIVENGATTSATNEPRNLDTAADPLSPPLPEEMWRGILAVGLLLAGTLLWDWIDTELLKYSERPDGSQGNPLGLSFRGGMIAGIDTLLVLWAYGGTGSWAIRWPIAAGFAFVIPWWSVPGFDREPQFFVLLRDEALGMSAIAIYPFTSAALVIGVWRLVAPPPAPTSEGQPESETGLRSQFRLLDLFVLTIVTALVSVTVATILNYPLVDERDPNWHFGGWNIFLQLSLFYSVVALPAMIVSGVAVAAAGAAHWPLGHWLAALCMPLLAGLLLVATITTSGAEYLHTITLFAAIHLTIGLGLLASRRSGDSATRSELQPPTR